MTHLPAMISTGSVDRFPDRSRLIGRMGVAA
jgi:hypothetical protein